MKLSVFTTLGFIFGLAFLFAVPEQAVAQRDDDLLRVRRIEAREVQAPRISISGVGSGRRNLRWLEVRTQYEVRPDWLDEATFTYYIVMRNRNPGQGESEYNMFQGEVTYMNIRRGRDLQSTVYLHPSTLERYGDVFRTAVVVRSQGRILAIESEPRADDRWWERLPPSTGYVLNRNQTPFAVVNPDDYEMIKQD